MTLCTDWPSQLMSRLTWLVISTQTTSKFSDYLPMSTCARPTRHSCPGSRTPTYLKKYWSTHTGRSHQTQTCHTQSICMWPAACGTFGDPPWSLRRRQNTTSVQPAKVYEDESGMVSGDKILTGTRSQAIATDSAIPRSVSPARSTQDAFQ